MILHNHNPFILVAPLPTSRPDLETRPTAFVASIILDNYFVLLCHIRSIVLLSVPCRSLVIRYCKDTKKFGINKDFCSIIWNIHKYFQSLQCERRSQVEPRCAALGFAASLVEERWHLRDDEQFDLATWLPSLKYRAGHKLTSFYCILARTNSWNHRDSFFDPLKKSKDCPSDLGFPRWEQLIPTAELICSHAGTKAVPRWEYFKYKLAVGHFFEQMQKNPEDLTFIFEKVPVYGHFRRFWGTQDLT